MPDLTPHPALGEELSHSQDLGAIAGHDSTDIGGPNRKSHTCIIVDKHSRKIRTLRALLSGTPTPAEGSASAPHLSEKLLYWGNSDTAGRLNYPVRGEYAPYPPLDGVIPPSSPEPVNQFAIGPKWRNVLSRSAHDVMAFNPKSNHLRDPGTHTTGHLPPTDAASDLKNKATYQLGRAVTGIAFHRVEQWMEFDAQRLAQYPAAVPDAENWLIWQDGTIPVAEDEIPIPNMSTMMAAICGDAVKEIAGLCVGAWVYLLNERIDASTYDSNMNSGGEIRLPDPAWDLWRPQLYLHRVTGTRSERSDQWAEIMGWFAEAHDHYLNSVAPSIAHAGDS